MKPDFSGWLKQLSAGLGGRLMPAAARCERFGDKPSPVGSKISAVCRAAQQANPYSCRSTRLSVTGSEVEIAGLGRLWARSAGIALAFAVFALALLGSAPVWSQSFVAPVDTTVAGGDDVELRTEVPQSHVGRSVEMALRQVSESTGARSICSRLNGDSVRCVSSGDEGQIPQLVDLGPAVQIGVGESRSCTLMTIAGRLRCWGEQQDFRGYLDLPFPVGVVTALDVYGGCAMLADGSLYCPDDPDSSPPELRPGDVVMSVWPRQLRPGERTAIRFTDLRESTGTSIIGTFTARIEVFGEGNAEVGDYYRLLDRNGAALVAETDGSYRIAGDPLVWLELLDSASGLPARLYIRPLELLSATLPIPSIRTEAQAVELSAGPGFSASTNTVTEGAGEVQLSIRLPLAHRGLRVELELAVSGSALAGMDYTLVATGLGPGIVLAGEGNSTITLRVESAPAEALNLALRPRADDRISQGDRLLNLRISRYVVISEEEDAVDLPPALDLLIRDDEPQLVSHEDGTLVCVHLTGGSLRCSVNDYFGQLPRDLGVVAQIAVGDRHICARTVEGGVRCWGSNNVGQSSVPADLGPVAQLGVGESHSCVLTVGGEARCWGSNIAGQSLVPEDLGDLGSVAQIAVGWSHSCAVTVGGEARCWGGDDPFSPLSPPPNNLGEVTQIAVGLFHTCALTVGGEVRCWGFDIFSSFFSPPEGLGEVTQIAVSVFHSCALTVGGEVRCWGGDEDGSHMPPDDLGKVAQIAVGFSLTCALTVGGEVRCWAGSEDGSSTPPDDLGLVAQLSAGRSYSCALTVEDGLRCWGLLVAERQPARPADLGEVAQIGMGYGHSCALTVGGEVRCWGADHSGQATVPGDLDKVAQIAVGWTHSCALTVGGGVRCWGSNSLGQSTPPDDLGAVVQIVAGNSHNCVLTVGGEVRCWGDDEDGQTLPPDDLGEVTQIAVGWAHSCALTVGGEVRCWEAAGDGSFSPPDDLGEVTQIVAGWMHTCALTAGERMRCWGDVIDVSFLPSGAVVAIDPSGVCALLSEGSLYCPNHLGELAPEPRSGDVAMSVWPRQLESGQRAAIRFTDLRATTAAFTARIEVFGEGEADVSSDYRLLDSSGQPLVAEGDANSPLANFPLVAGNSGNSGNSVLLTGNPPMAWLEASGTGRSSRLYVRPLELLSVSEPSPSIRRVAQPIGLTPGLTPGPAPGPTPGLSFTASTDTVTEGGEAVQLSIMLPGAHAGSMVELELAVSGTAMEGLDYTLAAADPDQGIVLGGGANSMITLRVNSAPAEPLRLLLRPRADDRISQGDRFLNLRISRYLVPEIGGTVDLPPALDFTIRDDEPPVAQQIQVGLNGGFACVRLDGGSVRCGGNNRDGRATPPDDLGGVAQLAVGWDHSCALTVSGRVRCWGSDEDGRSTPPDDLGQVAQLAAGWDYTCALTDIGGVRCWGGNGSGRSTPPDDLGPVVQLAVGAVHTCALAVGGEVRCWGSNNRARSTPPSNLGLVTQIAVGDDHSCALTVSGRVRCWGNNSFGKSSAQADLGEVTQIAVGDNHSCALTSSGRVRCWGSNSSGKSRPPNDLGPFVQLALGDDHSCALTISGQLRCWGDFIDISLLPAGSVTAIDASGDCALLVEGSVYCPTKTEFIPSGLGPSEVVMSVWPRQLLPGQRAAIRFAHLMSRFRMFAARIEVFREGEADVGSDYRLLDSNGQPLAAEDDGSYRLAGSPQPIAWLEALAAGRGSRLYVRPLELLPASGVLSIRLVAQPVELSAGPFFTASTDTLAEGAEEAQLNILLPLAHTGLQVELELAVIGTALAGSDYTLVAADPEQGIMLGGEATDGLTLRVQSAPAEPLRLLLRPRTDDRISQGDRFLNLRISSYRVVSEGGETVDLPPALDFTIRDDEPPTVQQIQVGGFSRSRNFACVLLNGGSVRCAGENNYGRTTPPGDLGPVAQLSVGESHNCALTVLGRVRCWGNNADDRSTPPLNLEPVAQIAVGNAHSCALTVSGEVRCWGFGRNGRTTPPGDLGPVAQLAVGDNHSCVLTVSGGVRCWEGNRFDRIDRITPPADLAPVAQIGVGRDHSCALTDSGGVRCWGSNISGRTTPPADLGPVAQIGVGLDHSCALTVLGRVRCWGGGSRVVTPPGDLGLVAQLSVGESHNCALMVSGELRCWGAVVDLPSTLPGLVTEIDASGLCILLAEGSVYCPDNPDLVPPGLNPGDVAMSVLPRQLRPGERAAIRFADLRGTAGAFTVRIEVFGDGSADVGSYYRLLDSNGMPLEAEQDANSPLANFPLVAGNSGNSGNSVLLTGNPPMAWLEASGDERPSRLYVRPLELLSASGPAPSIRVVAQPVELIDELFFTASTNTVAEGVEEVQLSIFMPLAHTGLQVEMELAVIGTAMAGSDYTLIAADSEQGIVLGGGENSTITLRVDSTPAEPLRLLLRSRADDPISQGDRFLNLRISRYHVISEGGGTTSLPPALDLIIRDDEPPIVQQIQVGVVGNFACALLNGGSVRCAGANDLGQATPPEDLDAVAQLGVGSSHSCALTIRGKVRCWGLDGNERRTTPPVDLAPVAQISVGRLHSCALTVSGQLRCWGVRFEFGVDRITPPRDDLGPFVQLVVGLGHSCAVTKSGSQVRCWGRDNAGQARPPADLGSVVQLSLGDFHSCALLVDGSVRCWGWDVYGQSSPPDDLAPVAQIAVGDEYSCALTVSGRVRCWGNNSSGRSTPPFDLEPVVQLAVGDDHSCALTVSGRLRCWGSAVAVSSLPPSLVVTAIDASGACVLLPEGSMYCPGRPELIPPELRPGDVVMSVWPLELLPGERAAIRFADLRGTAGEFTVRIEVFGDGSAEIGRYYRLLDRDGQPLIAEDDGSYLLEGGSPNSPNSPQLAGNSLEALADGRGSRLYVRPLELLSASVLAPSIRLVAQPVELSVGPFLTASTDTVTEGAEEAQLSVLLPLAHTGLRVEMELAASGTALAGSDYTLVAADPEQVIVLGGEVTDEITLRVGSAPTGPLRLLLRPRADDRISQGDRSLNLRLSRYRVIAEIGGTGDLPPALDLTIRDDEPPTVQQIQAGGFGKFACVLLSGGSVRCEGDNFAGRATPPVDLGPVAQIAVGELHSCALTVGGEVRCWGRDNAGQTRPPADLGPVAQLAVGNSHSCALTVSGRVRCWGSNSNGRSTPPEDLGPVAQLAVGRFHSCALTVSGGVRCWGSNSSGQSTPPEDLGQGAQIAVGDQHSCALMVSGEVRCWGSNSSGRSTPPEDLGPVAQLVVGLGHSCALTVSGGVRCWGSNSSGRSTPPNDLGPVAQLSVGDEHSCALTISGQLRCWGRVADLPSLLPGLVKAIDASGFCALLAEGSVYCPGGSTLISPELRPGDVVMSVLPQQLRPGQRAAIRFADLRETTGAFTVRIEVFGEGEADVSSYYRLLDSSGQPLVAEDDGSYRLEGGSPILGGDPNSPNSPQLAGNSLAGNSLEALVGGQGQPLNLYVRALDIVPAAGPVPSLRRAAQRVEIRNPEPFAGKLILQMHGGAKQLLLPTDVAPIPLRLLLVDSDDRPLSEPTVLTVQLQGMVTGDGAVVPSGPFEITASDTVAGTADIQVILGTSGETTLRLSVSDLVTGAVADLAPTVLRVTRLSELLDLDVTEDERLGTEDVISLIRFVSAGPDSLLPRPDRAKLQARLDKLIPADVVDLRLDLDGNRRMEVTDFRILLRYLAGLRGQALGESVRQQQVEELFR